MTRNGTKGIARSHEGQLIDRQASGNGLHGALIQDGSITAWARSAASCPEAAAVFHFGYTVSSC